MKAFRDFMRFYLVPIVLLLGILLTAGFTMFYAFTVRTRDGGVVSSRWPQTFTRAFARCLTDADGGLALSEEGKARLDDNGLWLQVLDPLGAEVTHYRKPAGTPASYPPMELLRLYQNGDGEYSVFIGSVEARGVSYAYLIGFPASISKIVMYVDAARYNSGKALIVTVIALTVVFVVTLSVFSYRTFSVAEKRRARDEKAKEEWIANITHDLKTPLAPIRGYAELLASEEGASAGEAGRYGGIILKNALYAQQLVDDLKLTYQLQSNMLPLKKSAQNITRFVRELVIDILNSPEYEGRSVSFAADQEDMPCAFDERLLRRALTNVLINALKHNGPGTDISVTLAWDSGITITVADSGAGMTPREMAGLFERYARGESRAEGSGLGMAIAKQIVEAHGGTISAESAAGAGTTVTLRLPL